MIQLVMSLLVTFAAIVLGLLTTSVKTVYDTAEHDRIQYAAQLTQLDRCMRNYGPGSETVRSQLRSYTAAVIASTWSSEPHPTGVPYPDTSAMPSVGATPILADMMNQIGVEIRRLDPPDPFRQKLAQDCYDVYLDVLRGRWAVIEDVYSSMSTPFFCAVVFWLVIVFAGFGLRAPANLSVLMVIGLCILSVTSALLIIVDMNLPYSGISQDSERADARCAHAHAEALKRGDVASDGLIAGRTIDHNAAPSDSSKALPSFTADPSAVHEGRRPR